MNTELLKLRILVAVQDLIEDQVLYAKVQFILVPPHFQLVPPHYVCSGDGTEMNPGLPTSTYCKTDALTTTSTPSRK